MSFQFKTLLSIIIHFFLRFLQKFRKLKKTNQKVEKRNMVSFSLKEKLSLLM